jgi:Tol biopolymer transport system component
MNTDGTNSRKVSEHGAVTNFDWSPDNSHLAFISCNKGYQDTLYLADTDIYDTKPVSCCDQINRKRKVLYSPDQNYLAFISSGPDCDNIYLYDLNQCKLTNITRYTYGMKISSFVWKIDGTKIYYAANDLFHCNLYSVSVDEGVKNQLTFTTASDMELDYRPRIF